MRNADLGHDLNTTLTDLKTTQSVSTEARKSVYAFQGAVRNITSQMDDALRTAIEIVHLRVNLIHKPSVKTPTTAPADVRRKGATNTATSNGSSTGEPSTATGRPAA